MLSDAPISSPIVHFSGKRLHSFAINRRRFKISKKLDLSIVERACAWRDSLWKRAYNHGVHIVPESISSTAVFEGAVANHHDNC